MLAKPTGRRAELQRLSAVPFAHRGLHGSVRIENSRAAFEAAIVQGHGIELDVQVSLDGEAFVVHDYDLDRLTDSHGAVASHKAAELQQIRLKDSEEALAPLSEILQLIDARVPLLIELKLPNRAVVSLCSSVYRSLETYAGPVAIMSFNPEAVRWFFRHAPHILRGLVVSESGKRNVRGRVERAISLWWSRPDFLAYDIRDLPSRFAAAQRRHGVRIFTWTVRSEGERARAAAHADQIIYEVQDS